MWYRLYAYMLHAILNSNLKRQHKHDTCILQPPILLCPPPSRFGLQMPLDSEAMAIQYYMKT